MKQILNELIDHRSLTRETAHRVLVDLATGKYNPSQTAAFMTVYMMRSITVDEFRSSRH
jgi:anthranilate phosphoribosyltransferase